MNINFLYSFYFFVCIKPNRIKILSFYDLSKAKVFLPSSWIFKSTAIHLNTLSHGNYPPYLLGCSLRENEFRKVKLSDDFKMKLTSNHELPLYIISCYHEKIT
tara:strand:+ start:1203 stop:1511 length:309 start_codon:yes stop_codon:yes gene_type:complete